MVDLDEERGSRTPSAQETSTSVVASKKVDEGLRVELELVILACTYEQWKENYEEDLYDDVDFDTLGLTEEQMAFANAFDINLRGKAFWLETDKAAYLLRQYFFKNLHDRLSTWPFLSLIEKKRLAFQLLYAVKHCHDNGICHGDIKCKNVLVTSWNWIYLADFASFKPTYIPHDDPSDFSFFFDTGFYEHGGEVQVAHDALLRPSMDIFAVRCVIAKLFLEGQPLFELSQLLAYRRGQYDPNQHLEKVALKTLIVIHLALREDDPTFRKELLNFQQREHVLQLANFKDDSRPIAGVIANAGDLDWRKSLVSICLLYSSLLYHLMGISSQLSSSVLMGCRPEGAAIAFEMPRHKAIKALDIYKRAGQQAESLSDFYEVCKGLELARNFQFPVLKGETPRMEYPERLMLTYKPEEDIEPAEDTNSSVDEAKPEPMDDFNVSNDDPAPPPSPPPPTFNSQDPDDLLICNNVADNLGALRANDELLDLRLGDSGTKVSKFSNYIRIVFDRSLNKVKDLEVKNVIPKANKVIIYPKTE
ncbi:armadillo-like helical domain-containing protein [Tanacetum coccineum]|uniref:Armadillo-like helical domain-containing protein n=1 Tax=Tanacetum coccineum TaxID=301880 RepID=A0ABQ4XJ09_9ASTR